MKNLMRNLLTGLVLLGAVGVHADNEPSDNSSGGATTLTLNASTYGTIDTGDFDYYKITNTAGWTSITVNFQFTGVNPDNCGLKVLNSDLSQIEGKLTVNQKVSITFSAGKNKSYFILIEGIIADGGYDLTVTGSGVDTWSAYYTYAGLLYNYYYSIGSYSQSLSSYYYYYAIAEYLRYSAAGNVKFGRASYWWNYAVFAYYYYASFGDYSSANAYYNYYVSVCYTYL